MKDKKDLWELRSAKMKCQTCAWFLEKETIIKKNYPTIPDQTIGRCRRHAPTFNGFPAVYMNDWCGDHRLDQDKI